MSEINLNEAVEETVDDATVMTVPIDDTLSISGEAADAKAVGDALALKADASSIQNIKVNEEQADNQGQILLYGTDVPMSSTDTTTLKAAIEANAAKTGADINVSGSDSTKISAKLAALDAKTTDGIMYDSANSVTASAAIEGELSTNEIDAILTAVFS